MYIPSAHRVDDPAKLRDFMVQYSFATLVTTDGAVPFVSHLPMLFRPGAGDHGTLISHMARANPHWHHFASDREALAVFHGPHCYISPTWYKSKPAVPTWNYTAVHAYGVPMIIHEQPSIVALLNETVSAYESGLQQPWSGELPVEFRDTMIKAIVAFEIPIRRIEGKFKLSQNRPAADQIAVIEALSSSNDPDSRAVAQWMLDEAGAAPR